MSQKAGYRSTAGRQSAEANMTRRQQAGSQKSKELAGFRITTPAGIRYRKQGCKKGNLKMLGITAGWVTVWGWWENGLVGFSSKWRITGKRGGELKADNSWTGWRRNDGLKGHSTGLMKINTRCISQTEQYPLHLLTLLCLGDCGRNCCIGVAEAIAGARPRSGYEVGVIAAWEELR